MIELAIKEGLEVVKEVSVESQEEEEEPYHWRLKAACRDQMKWVKAEVWKNIKYGDRGSQGMIYVDIEVGM